MILLIDNYDSFVHNLGRYVRRLGHEIRVLRNDTFQPTDPLHWNVDAIIVSPGPCTPNEAGVSLATIRECGPHLPVLGICLGHQAIAAVCGGRVVRAARPVHGQADNVYHDDRFEFCGLPQPFSAGRYHSLVVDEASLPATLEVSARTEDGIVMGLRHRTWKLTGWQFHPESVLTDVGYRLLQQWLQVHGLQVSERVPSREDEVDLTMAYEDAQRFWES